MTDDERHAEVITVLEEIRDAVRALRPAPVTPTNPFAGFAEMLMLKTAGIAAAGRSHPSPPWSGDIAPVDGEPCLLVAGGVRWEWQPGVQHVYGPLCHEHPYLNRIVMRYQSATGGPVRDVDDALPLGPSGWLVCDACGHQAAVAGLGFNVGAIRGAVDAAFRGRLGLAAKGR